MTFRKYYTKDTIIDTARNCTSIAGFLRGLGLVPKGHNYNTAKKLIEQHNIDISHWTGSLWSKGKHLKQGGAYVSNHHRKKSLISERGHKCEKCKNTTWNELPITIELEHIDGDRTNNLDDNLLLLCPNCHSQTPTWRRQKNSLVPPEGLEPSHLTIVGLKSTASAVPPKGH